MQYAFMLLHSGGFSSSIVTQQRGDMSLIERKVQVVYSMPVVVGLCQAIQWDSNRQSWEVFFSITRQATFTYRNIDKEKQRCSNITQKLKGLKFILQLQSVSPSKKAECASISEQIDLKQISQMLKSLLSNILSFWKKIILLFIKGHYIDQKRQ